MDTAESAQPPAGGAYVAQNRDLDPTVIAENDEFHLPGPMNDQADLAVQLRGKGGYGTGKIPPDNLIRADFFLSQPLQLLNLLCF